jgi:hypothetical protein
MRPASLASLCLTLIAAALVFASPAAAQSRTPQPCRYFTSCTPVVGPWVTTPSDGGNLYQLVCPDGQRALGSDAVFAGAIYPVGVETAGGQGPGNIGLEFAAFPAPVSVTFKPGIGCTQGDATLRRPSVPGRYRIRVRTRRIHPRREVRVRLGCARGTRLVGSGSGLGFYTRRPPSSRTVKRLEHRHRRTGSVTRTHVAAPAGVGDNERVELQVSVVCRPAR